MCNLKIAAFINCFIYPEDAAWYFCFGYNQQQMPEIVIRICMIIIVLLPKPSRHNGFIKFKACGTLKRQEEQIVAPHLLIYLFVLFSESRAAIRRGNQERSPLEQGKNTAKKLRGGECGRASNECRTGLVDVINNWRSAEAAGEQRTAGTELDASILDGVTGNDKIKKFPYLFL